MRFPRASGILLHPTSLPSQYGIGDFGHSAYEFVDFLKESKQSLWQILPLGPTGYGDSPYQCFSAFAGNTNLISPDMLIKDSLLIEVDLADKPNFPNGRVDFGLVIDWKEELLRKAFLNFCGSRDSQGFGADSLAAEFHAFCLKEKEWLDDYSLFRTIKSAEGQAPWTQWKEPLRFRNGVQIDEFKNSHGEEIEAQKFYQFLFFRQWSRLKLYANDAGIKIIGDMPIFVALDSADVWADPENFKLEADSSPKVVAGVPPDFFSATGQLWGNPIYQWERMKADGYSWWVNRFRSLLEIVDIARIDHFRGFVSSWEVPGDEKTAENGSWVEVPGEELFARITDELGELPVIAEDLGDITPEVYQLRDQFSFPGMGILQFGFGGDSKNRDLPHNYEKNCVVYTATHDNDTTVGWFFGEKRGESAIDEAEFEKIREFCARYLDSDGNEINWDFIRAVWASVADTAIAPMQDLLGLDNKARMNLPATKSNNWQWQCNEGVFSEKVCRRLREITEVFGRATEDSAKRKFKK